MKAQPKIGSSACPLPNLVRLISLSVPLCWVSILTAGTIYLRVTSWALRKRMGGLSLFLPSFHSRNVCRERPAVRIV